MRSLASSQPFRTWLALFASSLLISFLWNSPQSIYFTNDGASTLAVAKGILTGEYPLAGPPAARGGRHFGPWYFFWQSIFLFLAGGDVSTAVLLETVGKCLALSVGCLFLLRSLIPERFLFISGVGASLTFLSSSWWWTLRTPWHSNFVTVLSWPLLFLLVRSFGGNVPQLGLLLFLGSLTFQSHLATAPLVLSCGSALLLLRLFRREEDGNQRSTRTGLLFFLLAAISWLPSLFYHVTTEGGLFGAEGGGDSKAPREGLLRAFFLSGRVLRRFTLGDYEWSSLLSPLPEGAAQWFAVFFQLLFLGYVLRSFLCGELLGRLRLGALLAVASAYIVAIAVLRRPVHPHYESSILILAPLLVGISLSQVVESIERALFFTASPTKRAFRLIPGFSFLALGFFVCFQAARLNIQTLQRGPFPQFQTLAHAEELADTLRELGLHPDADGFLINEANRLRESAFLLFLGKDFFPQMQYAKYFHELSQFRDRSSEPAKRLFLISCERASDRAVERHVRSYVREQEYDLSRCRTCTGCSLSSWARRLTAPPQSVGESRTGVQGQQEEPLQQQSQTEEGRAPTPE